MNFFRKKNFTLNKSERTLVSCILNAAREALATPLHLPSIEQVKLKLNAPFGSQQMILLYLELFLITLEQNYLQLDAKPPERKRHFPLATPIELSDTKRRESKKSFNICNFVSVNSSIRTRFASIFHEPFLFAKTLSKEKGCGPMEYFNRIKIQRAKAMIRDGSKNFTEIAGFLPTALPIFFQTI